MSIGGGGVQKASEKAPRECGASPVSGYAVATHTGPIVPPPPAARRIGTSARTFTRRRAPSRCALRDPPCLPATTRCARGRARSLVERIFFAGRIIGPAGVRATPGPRPIPRTLITGHYRALRVFHDSSRPAERGAAGAPAGGFFPPGRGR